MANHFMCASFRLEELDPNQPFFFCGIFLLEAESSNFRTKKFGIFFTPYFYLDFRGGSFFVLAF